MKSQPVNSDCKKSHSNDTLATRKSFKLQKTEATPFSSKKIFHSPMNSLFSGKISNHDTDHKKNSIHTDGTLSQDIPFPYYSTRNNESPSLKTINFFIPNLKNSDSKFLQKIKSNYEKKLQLINEVEIKKFNTSGNDENSFWSNRAFQKNDTSNKLGVINFVEINTSKGDDRSGFIFI